MHDLAVPTPRFEYKYRVPEIDTVEIDRLLGFHLEPDEHSRGGEYVVNSLYFDTPTDEDARETDEGVILRSKVRLRCYSLSPEPPYFLELKQRYGSSIYKTRVRLDPRDAERMASGLPPVVAYRQGADASTLDRIREVIDHREMSPRVWVKYTRRAWVSPWGDGVRATLDRDLEAQAVEPFDALRPMLSGWAFPELDARPVLELKFFGAAPEWMRRLSRRLELSRTSCSKYGLSLFSIEGPTALPHLAEAS